MQNPVLFFCPQMWRLAGSIHYLYPLDVELGMIGWKKFQDGYPKLFVHDVESLRGRDVAFLASFDTPADIFSQLAVIYALPRFGVNSLRVVLPYFPTATKDRVEREGEIVTSMTLARMLSCIPLTRTGPVEIIIYDIHALQEQFYFSDQVMPRLEKAASMLLRSKLSKIDNVAIAYPDEGSYKRFAHHFTEFEYIRCDKIRDGDKRIVTLKDGSPKGKHVVIVDDLSHTGGTLIECAQLLRSEGASDLSAYVTHAVFSNESWRKVLPCGFTHFWMTDSCAVTEKAVYNHGEPFEILSLAPLIADAIR